MGSIKPLGVWIIVVGIVADIEPEYRTIDPDSKCSSIDVPALWTGLRPSRARDYLPTDAESPWGAPGAGSLKGISGRATTFCHFVTMFADWVSQQHVLHRLIQCFIHFCPDSTCHAYFMFFQHE